MDNNKITTSPSLEALPLDAWEELYKEAEAGPWEVEKFTLIVNHEQRKQIANVNGSSAEARAANARFIAAARVALPQLIARVRAQEADLVELRKDRDLDTDRLQCLADELRDQWFHGHRFDVSDATALRRAIDNAARDQLLMLQAKLKAIDAATKEGKP